MEYPHDQLISNISRSDPNNFFGVTDHQTRAPKSVFESSTGPNLLPSKHYRQLWCTTCSLLILKILFFSFIRINKEFGQRQLGGQLHGQRFCVGKIDEHKKFSASAFSSPHWV
jgi:hypothetical protein